MKVVRYFHIRCYDAAGTILSKGGATCRVEADTNSVGSVKLAVAFCNKKDNFHKAVGRAIAFKAPEKVVSLRQLHNELTEIRREVERRVFGRSTEDNNPTNFDFAIRYFLPK